MWRRVFGQTSRWGTSKMALLSQRRKQRSNANFSPNSFSRPKTRIGRVETKILHLAALMHRARALKAKIEELEVRLQHYESMKMPKRTSREMSARVLDSAINS